MTSAAEPTVLLHADGRVIELAHGLDPADVLAAEGLRLVRPRSAVLTGEHELTIEVETEPMPPVPLTTGRTRHDPDVDAADLPGATRRRRLAAYALVRDGDRALLTVLSERATTAPGTWALPGGGIDPGEQPEEAVVREVWEETGQHVRDLELVAVSTDHWVGRGPTGVLEDFQPIRLVYRAVCPDPGEPVVHDIGGTTAEAHWLPVDVVRAPDFPTSKRTAAVLDLL